MGSKLVLVYVRRCTDLDILKSSADKELRDRAHENNWFTILFGITQTGERRTYSNKYEFNTVSELSDDPDSTAVDAWRIAWKSALSDILFYYSNRYDYAPESAQENMTDIYDNACDRIDNTHPTNCRGEVRPLLKHAFQLELSFLGRSVNELFMPSDQERNTQQMTERALIDRRTQLDLTHDILDAYHDVPPFSVYGNLDEKRLILAKSEGGAHSDDHYGIAFARVHY